MARKRMISPEIWESQNFSLLSDTAKIVFISLFSHADDEGRGRADPTYIKSSTFPYDEGRRVADIKSALSEIARSMSVQFYSVNGIEYYFMTSWGKWQKVEKPSPSKLPPPPIVGEGGGIHSNEKFGEYSGSNRGIFGEPSSTNRIERNGIEGNIPPTCAHAQKVSAVETELGSFCQKYGIYIDVCVSYLDDFDFALLDKAYAESKTYLQDKDNHPFAQTLSWIVKNYASIISGKFRDKKSAGKNKGGIIDSWQALHDKYEREEGDGDT